MTTLADCLYHLAIGKLSNSGWIDPQTGDFFSNRTAIVVRMMNEGLLRLYSRLNLKQKSLLVQCSENRTRYELTKEHILTKKDFTSASDPDHPDFDCPMLPYDRYILSTEFDEEFDNDIIKIMSVVDNFGHEVPLNNPSEYLNVSTPEFNVLEVSLPTNHLTLGVTYQAKHPELNIERLGQVIELPDNLLDALYAYVAYLVYANINTTEAVQNSQKYLQMFTAILDEIIKTDTATTSSSQTSIKFHRNGWC